MENLPKGKAHKIVLFALFLFSPVLGADPIGFLYFADGSGFELFREGRAFSYFRLEEELLVYPGDIFFTKEDSTLKIYFYGRKILKLSPNSSVEIAWTEEGDFPVFLRQGALYLVFLPLRAGDLPRSRYFPSVFYDPVDYEPIPPLYHVLGLTPSLSRRPYIPPEHKARGSVNIPPRSLQRENPFLE